ncbi:MAG: hypothetical protein LBR85_04220 [Oscillospiraceae bacterium]|jgi:DNA-directed RNA polymerase specialized sigma subunit|nr:hypothetical protein [Oscillospiraceae bacterium]
MNKNDPSVWAVRRALNMPRGAARSLNEKKTRITRLEALAKSLCALPGSARLDAARAELERLREALVADVLDYGVLIRSVQELIERTLPDPRHRAVMEAHYLGFSTWEAVAEQCSFSVRHVHRLHAQALCLMAAGYGRDAA